MGSSHLNGQETVPASQDESRMQVSGETSLLSQNSDEFLAEEKDDILSDDSASAAMTMLRLVILVKKMT